MERRRREAGSAEHKGSLLSVYLCLCLCLCLYFLTSSHVCVFASLSSSLSSTSSSPLLLSFSLHLPLPIRLGRRQPRRSFVLSRHRHSTPSHSLHTQSLTAKLQERCSQAISLMQADSINFPQVAPSPVLLPLPPRLCSSSLPRPSSLPALQSLRRDSPDA